MGNRSGGEVPSDALVLFGVTGDLAHKMIFPALYEMAKRGALTVPVVGVASPPENLHGAQAGAVRCPAPGALPRHSAVALRDGHQRARR